MAVKLTSYINLNGNAREAVHFYASVFNGEVHIDSYEDYAGGMPVDESQKDKIMHASVQGDQGILLFLSDLPVGSEVQKGSLITLALNGDDEVTLRGYWDKLAEGGTITMPLEKAPWGDTFGVLTDKFGVNWMVNVAATQDS